MSHVKHGITASTLESQRDSIQRKIDLYVKDEKKERRTGPTLSVKSAHNV